MALLCCIAAGLLGLCTAPAASADEPAAGPVVINEIHYRAPSATEWVEFIELYNTGSGPVDLSGWLLRGGVEFEFPPGTLLQSGGYLVAAESPQTIQARFGITSLGPYRKRLAIEGETVELWDAAARLADRVDYACGFPWPIVADGSGVSIQLMNPGFDNTLAAAWRSAAPTPGRANAVLTQNAPPYILSVHHAPQQPRPGEPVVITVQVNDYDGIDSVRLGYQLVLPGSYVAITDPGYAPLWTWLPMTPNAAGLYEAVLPPEMHQHRALVRYRVEAVDRGGRRVTVPYADDPQPNFAFFVYGDMPTWRASVSGAPDPAETFDFGQMRSLPIYFFIAKQRDIADSLFLPPSELASGYTGSEYLWRGTLVYDGIVYDHVRFRARGGAYRFQTGKTHWKIDFLDGHQFQAYDDLGLPYPVLRDKLNLSAVMQRGFTNQRGEQGMFESVTFRLFNLAGVPAPETHFVHMRVVDSPIEEGANQYGGDFWGLYLAIEQLDGAFLRQHDLPDGNLYKMEYSRANRNHQGRAGPSDNSDIRRFQAMYPDPTLDAQWWRASFDLESYYSYRSVVEFARHYDLGRHNYFTFSHPVTKQWTILPWDTDNAWSTLGAGNGIEPFLTPVLSRPEFILEYQNRLRELRDLLLNLEQLAPLLEEQANKIDSPRDGLSMVDANRAKWDNNPILVSRYVVSSDARPGTFYLASPDGTFPGMVEAMKTFAQERIQYIDTTLLTDRDQPETPAISYAGAIGFSADSVRLAASDFADPQGADTFAAMEWRVAEVTDPSAPAYRPEAPFRFEIEAVWESGALPAFVREVQPPAGTVQPGHAYRARVRFQDTTGRWSHWSAPLEFVAGAPASSPAANLVISEIMYHPRALVGMLEEDLEYIEILNTGAASIDLSGTRIAGGIDFTFPAGTLLEGGGYAVVAGNPGMLEKMYEMPVFGPFDGRLANSADTVALIDAWGRTIASVGYDDAAPWPAGADGDGYSLVYSAADGAPGDPAAWRGSAEIGGSPGHYDPQTVLINELLLFPQGASAIELYNPGARSIDIGYWFLGSGTKPAQVQIPPGTRIGAESMLVLRGTQLQGGPGTSGLAWLARGGGSLALSSGDAANRMTGYRHLVLYEEVEPGVSTGRLVDSAGVEHFPAQSSVTLGQANAGPRVGPVVISAVGYRSDAGGQSIELTNISNQPVALYDPEVPGHPWVLHGGYYQFPAGVVLPAFGRVLVVQNPPQEACLHVAGQGFTRILGPFTRSLSDTGQRITLYRPVQTESGWVLVKSDEVDYGIGQPWPALRSDAPLLRRTRLAGFGSDPDNWTAGVAPPDQSEPPSALYMCSFSAIPDSSKGLITISWWLQSATLPSQYRLLRGLTFDREEAVEVMRTAATDAPIPSMLGSFVDLYPDSDPPPIYWLDLIDTDGNAQPAGMTSVERSFRHQYLPLIAR